MANDKSFKIKNGLSAGRYLGTNGTETAGSNGPYGTFSTDLYTADGTSSQTITNNVDLSTDGGLVLLKSRDTTSATWWYDTERGVTKELRSDAASAESTESTGLTAFNTDGFTFGSRQNQSAYGNSVAWTFKQASNFFDVVTFTSAASGNTTFSHNLGSEPGFVVIKNTQTSDPWIIYHRSTGTTKLLAFTALAASEQGAGTFTATSTNFTVSSNLMYTSQSYVAYLFAHDTSADGYIQCGSYTGNGSATGPEIDLGWKPSWLMVKAASSSGDWWIVDSVRGVVDGGNDPRLLPNASDAEASSNYVKFTSTGFQPEANFGIVNGSGIDYIYVAIRAVVPTQTLDLSTGHTFSITPTDATDVLFSNPPASGVATGFTVEVNNSAGGYAITWPSSVKWHLGTAPTATASKEVYTFITTDGGTTYYGKKAGENLA